MEDSYDNIPVQYRTERIGRMRDLITQIESDHALYETMKQKIEEGRGDDTDNEELQKKTAWLKRNLLVYRRFNSMSIEGITCGELSSNRRSFFPENCVAFHR